MVGHQRFRPVAGGSAGAPPLAPGNAAASAGVQPKVSFKPPRINQGVLARIRSQIQQKLGTNQRQSEIEWKPHEIYASSSADPPLPPSSSQTQAQPNAYLKPPRVNQGVVARSSKSQIQQKLGADQRQSEIEWKPHEIYASSSVGPPSLPQTQAQPNAYLKPPRINQGVVARSRKPRIKQKLGADQQRQSEIEWKPHDNYMYVPFSPGHHRHRKHRLS